MAVLRDTPYGAYAFHVEIDGIGSVGFCEAAGLDQAVEVLTYRNGADPLTPRILPGLPKPATVTLRRGVTGDLALQEWFALVRDGRAADARRAVRIDLLSEARDGAVLSWRLRNALPVRLEGPRLDANSSATAVEALTLVAEAIDVE